jgi:hypothetical protein
MPLSSGKRALIAVAVLLLLILAAAGIFWHRMHRPLPPASAGRPPDIMSLLPSDSPAVTYIDAASLRGLQGSPLAAILGLASPGPQVDRDYAQFVQATGFDYTRDLDHAAIAFWPAGLATPQNPMGDDRSVVLAEGRFDQPKITAYALRTGRAEMHGTQTVYEVPGNPPVAFEFLSTDRIELASGKDAASLLGPAVETPRDPVMEERIHRVAGAPIFAVARMDRMPNSFYANFRNAPQVDHYVRSLRALSLSGQPEGDHIDLALDAECDSMKNAVQISTLLETFRMLGSFAINDPRTRSQMTREQYEFTRAFLKQLKISPQDHWVRLTFVVTPDMLRNASH